MNLKELAIKMHYEHKGKIEVISKVPVKDSQDLSIAYTPGVAEPCKEINRELEKVYDYTAKGNLVAVVTDGSAVLGLGDIGPEAGMPVMEGKAVLFKTFAGVDAFPICLAIILKPKSPSAKYSGGPNFSASLTNGTANKTSAIVPIRPPVTEDTIDIPKALPGSPFLHIGYPSTTVAAAAGVPGVPIQIAVIEPA